MKRLVVAAIFSCSSCRAIPEACIEFCASAEGCGLLATWIGSDRDNCELRCARASKEDWRANAIVFQRTIDCADVVSMDTNTEHTEWCAGDQFAGCAALVDCLEKNVPVILTNVEIAEGEMHQFAALVELHLITGSIAGFETSAYLDVSNPLEEFDCVPTYSCVTSKDDACLEEDVTLTPPRLTFSSFCEHFDIATLGIGLARRTCRDSVCKLSVVAEAEPVSCADLWNFDDQIVETFPKVRVGPVVPFMRVVGPLPVPGTPDDAEECWQVFGAPMVVTRDGIEPHSNNALLLRLPDITEIEDDPALVSACDAL